MKLTRVVQAVVLFAALMSLGGCAEFRRQLSASDDLIDVLGALNGHDQTNAYPVELVSQGSGRIATGHARKDAGGVLVSGYVEKRGPGFVSAAWSHVDVVVRNPQRRVLVAFATRFFPSDIPNTQRGIKGRSRYVVRLPFEPPVGSTIKMAFHDVPISQCRYPRDDDVKAKHERWPMRTSNR